jgi:hypothetical protein
LYFHTSHKEYKRHFILLSFKLTENFNSGANLSGGRYTF